MRLAAVLALTGIAHAAPAAAQSQEGRGFGLGLIIGSPTGLSLKGFLSPEHAIDGAVGFGLIGGDDLRVHADLLWQFRIQSWSSAALDLHVGVGPELGFHGHRDPHGDDHLNIGVRGPIGLSLMFTPAPFEVFLEIAAGLWIVERPDFHLDAAIGGRYYF
jgi:hypothetical protein